MIWSINNNTIKCELSKEINTEMPNIKKVLLTLELPRETLSPILFFNDYSIRWSSSVNHWVIFNPKIPHFFKSNNSDSKTIADYEFSIKESLIYCDSQLFISSIKQIIPIYLRIEPKKAEVLFKQLLKRKGEFIRTYCGLNIDDIINSFIEIIQNTKPEFLEDIKKSKEWEFSHCARVEIEHKSWQIDRPSSMFIGEEEEEPEPE